MLPRPSRPARPPRPARPAKKLQGKLHRLPAQLCAVLPLTRLHAGGPVRPQQRHRVALLPAGRRAHVPGAGAGVQGRALPAAAGGVPHGAHGQVSGRRGGRVGSGGPGLQEGPRGARRPAGAAVAGGGRLQIRSLPLSGTHGCLEVSWNKPRRPPALPCRYLNEYGQNGYSYPHVPPGYDTWWVEPVLYVMKSIGPCLAWGRQDPVAARTTCCIKSRQCGFRSSKRVWDKLEHPCLRACRFAMFGKGAYYNWSVIDNVSARSRWHRRWCCCWRRCYWHWPWRCWRRFPPALLPMWVGQLLPGWP